MGKGDKKTQSREKRQLEVPTGHVDVEKNTN